MKKKEEKTNNKKQENEKDKEKNKELEKELKFSIHINDEGLNSIDNNEKSDLEKIKNQINNILADDEFKLYQNELYSALTNLSKIISIINNYEIDNILVYLKNLLEPINNKLKDLNIKQKISLLKEYISLDIERYKIKDEIPFESEINSEENISKIFEIYEANSFSDFEYGSINRIAENIYENKLKYFEINKDIDYNKESYFYTYKYCYDYKTKMDFNYISNKEIEQRIREDHLFYQNYYNESSIILNYSDISKINILLSTIINNDDIKIEDISKFIGTRYSKRKNNTKNNLNKDKNFDVNEKISLLNRLFRKCPIESFTKYINAHIINHYFNKINIDGKKYCIPEKLLFYNYYNNYHIMDKIQSEQTNKYNESEEDEVDDNDSIEEEEEEISEESED